MIRPIKKQLKNIEKLFKVNVVKVVIINQNKLKIKQGKKFIKVL